MRILVVRIGRAGDMVMTSPALTAIIHNYPGARITLLTSSDGRRILKNFHPAVDQTWVWQRSGIGALFKKTRLRNKISLGGFDKIFCFDTSERIASLLTGLDADLHWHQARDHDHRLHCSRNYLNLVQSAVGREIEDIRPSLYLSAEAEQELEQELKERDISAGDTVVMLHPSFSGSSRSWRKNSRSLIHRQWPARNFSELGHRLGELQLPGVKKPKIVVDLIPGEAPLGEEIRKFAKGAVTLLIGSPNFERYKALIKRANLLVSPNTGPMHFAAAMNTPVVALFSDWDPVDCGPYMPADRFTVIRAEDTAHPEQGLSAISVESVFQACERHLAE